MMFKVIFMLLVFVWMVPGAFPAEFYLNSQTFSKWQVKNYEQMLKFEIDRGLGPGKEFLRIIVADPTAPELPIGEKADTAFWLTSPVIYRGRL